MTMKRSRRKPRISPKDEANKWCEMGSDQEGFEVKFLNKSIGYGLYTTKQFEKDSFLLEYRGVLSAASEDTQNEEYTFHFKHQGADFSISNKQAWVIHLIRNNSHMVPHSHNLPIRAANHHILHLDLLSLSKLHLCSSSSNSTTAEPEPATIDPATAAATTAAAATAIFSSSNSAAAEPEPATIDPATAAAPMSPIQSAEASSRVALTQPQSSCLSQEDSAVPMEEFSDSSVLSASCESDSGEDEDDALFVTRGRRVSPTYTTNDDDSDPDYLPSDPDLYNEGSEVFPLTDTATDDKKSHVSIEEKALVKQTCMVTSCVTANSTEQEEVCSEKGGTYKKPYRFCMYCKQFKSKLSDHLAKKHMNEERVKNALRLPKKQRIEEFDRIRKEGTFEVNKERARDDEPSYERERKSSSKGNLVICGSCSGAYAAGYMKKHKRTCVISSESSSPSLNIKASLLQLAQSLDGQFLSEVLGRFRTDEIGLLCQQDEVLIDIGRRLWNKQKKKMDKRAGVRKSVMTDMRRLAGLYLALKDTQEKLGPLPVHAQNVSDLMQRSNFRHLEEAIEKFTEREESTEGGGIKAGLKVGLFYLLKSSSKILKATFLMADQDGEAEQIDRFIAVLDLQYNNVFGDATYHLNRNREEKLRKPSGQSLESDIKVIREYTTTKISELVGNELEFFDKHRFVELRDCTVARLTLFNARRGGEPSRLFIKCWEDAKSGVWLDKQQLENLDPIDKILAKDIRVGYQTGKGRHLVPVLFPKDTHKALDILVDKEVRSTAAVLSDNTYLFPTTTGTDSHVSGWHALDNICDKVALTDRRSVTATKNRHRVSVLFALEDVPEADRGYIFKHLGHSEETNCHVYQAPLAIKEITVVGKRLQCMDKGTSDDHAAHSDADDDASGPSLTHANDHAAHSDADDDANSASRGKQKMTSTLPRKVHKYTKWRRCDEQELFRHFDNYLKGKGGKKLPGKKDIIAFLQRHPSFPHGINTIHNKMMNEVYKRSKKCLSVV
ncbi:uncharacterized protein [Diadema antillarum]|uniref:uncharacterized protein n=1 Tax=Diadema antillarum TaxID=105358 RepID=UPI003A8B6FB1